MHAEQLPITHHADEGECHAFVVPMLETAERFKFCNPLLIRFHVCIEHTTFCQIIQSNNSNMGVHDAGSWVRSFSELPIFPLELTWVLTPFLKNPSDVSINPEV